jgi:hypothetical protein
MVLANLRECQHSALDESKDAELMAILVSPYYRP